MAPQQAAWFEFKETKGTNEARSFPVPLNFTLKEVTEVKFSFEKSYTPQKNDSLVILGEPKDPHVDVLVHIQEGCCVKIQKTIWEKQAL